VKLDLGTHKGMHSVLALKLGMTNKDLIISMSIKQEFMYPKRKKIKRDPPILINSNEGSFNQERSSNSATRCFYIS
jgi:hypothetical protein